MTVEEHSIYGGLGGAVAELLSREHPVPLEIVGIQDTFAESARSYDELLDKYALGISDIVEAVNRAVQKKRLMERNKLREQEVERRIRSQIGTDKKIKFERFIPEEFEGTEEISNKKYPFVLFTFRSRYHFLSGEATSKSKTLMKMPDGPYFYINEEDAREMKIKDGDEIKVSSKVASIKGRVKIDKRIPKGFVGTHFHFENLLINKLFPLQFDEETFTPNFKTVAVRIKPI